LLLKNNAIFQARIAGVRKFYTCLLVGTALFTVIVGWVFYPSGFTFLFFLCYPGTLNLIKLSQSIYNFSFQLKHSLSLHEEANNNNNQDHDQRMIKKLYLNHIFVISQKALDIMYVLMLMRAGGGLNLNFFPLA
jgi:hypothetical protein